MAKVGTVSADIKALADRLERVFLSPAEANRDFSDAANVVDGLFLVGRCVADLAGAVRELAAAVRGQSGRSSGDE